MEIWRQSSHVGAILTMMKIACRSKRELKSMAFWNFAAQLEVLCKQDERRG